MQQEGGKAGRFGLGCRGGRWSSRGGACLQKLLLSLTRGRARLGRTRSVRLRTVIVRAQNNSFCKHATSGKTNWSIEAAPNPFPPSRLPVASLSLPPFGAFPPSQRKLSSFVCVYSSIAKRTPSRPRPESRTPP